MKKFQVIMTRERITHAFEHKINPEDPDDIKENLFENEDNSGWWNEYYRVIVVDKDWDGSYEQLQDGEDYDFYSYTEAKKFYDEKVAELKTKGEYYE